MATSPLICLSFFLLFSSATCFNITKILNTYPDFQNFNNYLSKTKLADEVNRRQTITVLAVANDAMGAVTGSDDVIKRIMSTHVVLDYYDQDKLSNLKKGTTLLTTLFQSSGEATNQQGFLNGTRMKNGDIVFGSAVEGSAVNARLVKKVAAQPYNISVLQISNPIIADGIQNLDKSAASPKKAPSPPPKVTPKKAPSPTPSEAGAPAPVSDAPAADAPTAADVPASSPPSPVADGPETADGVADAPGPSGQKKNSGSRLGIGAFVGTVMVAVSSWVAL